MGWEGEGHTDKGLVRYSNQDAFSLNNTLSFWTTADGMGGRAGGDIASRLAVDTIEGFVTHSLTSPTLSKEKISIPSLLSDSIFSANQAIQDYVKQHPHFQGMGTTVVVLHISPLPPMQACIAHVGDSRAYLFRDHALSQLTRDHSWVEKRIREGKLTPAQIKGHPMEHVLIRGVGIEQTVKPEVTTVPLLPGDTILLCSDGLTKMLTDEEILQCLMEPCQESLSTGQRLIEEANRLGGQDNTTVVLVQYNQVQGV
ncbi:MAG: protein phosphatase 2C domain-containing protein [Nitrospirae bacterium]|nr:protein phosphatase 2C domain-containing protein [Nitrospirota bacterium]